MKTRSKQSPDFSKKGVTGNFHTIFSGQIPQFVTHQVSSQTLCHRIHASMVYLPINLSQISTIHVDKIYQATMDPMGYGGISMIYVPKTYLVWIPGFCHTISVQPRGQVRQDPHQLATYHGQVFLSVDRSRNRVVNIYIYMIEVFCCMLLFIFQKGCLSAYIIIYTYQYDYV